MNEATTNGHIRDSGIELLRIICIFAILANHHVVLSPWMQALGMEHNSLTPGKIFLQCFGMFGRTACTAFMLMTGYYSCLSIRPHHYRRIVPLITQAIFWSIALHFLLPWLFGIDTWHYRPHEWIYTFCPFFSGGGIWFVTQYIAFWCFIPIINPMLGALTKNQFHLIFFLFGVFWVLPGTILPSDMQPEWSFGGMAYFFFAYSIGAYLRMFRNMTVNAPNSGIRRRWNHAFCALVSITAMCGSVLILDATGAAMKSNAMIAHAMHFCIESSILSVICSVSVFTFFLRLRLRSHIVNWIASSVLGIYLIHALCPHYFIWHNISPISMHPDNLAGHAIAKCFLVFVSCLVLDKIRHYTIGRLGRHLLDLLWPEK